MSDLISCLCLTIPGREEFLKRAVACFHKQTYPNKQLVIVADSACDKAGLNAAIAAHPGTAEYWIDERQLTIGAKRNLGCQVARGEYIAIWDDDDYSSPRRLTEQYALLKESGKDVTTLYRIYFTNADQSMWWLSDAGWIDTSMMFKRSFWRAHPFGDKQIGAEGDFMREAVARHQLHIGGDSRWMFATNHPGNTADRACMYGPNNALKNFIWKD